MRFYRSSPSAKEIDHAADVLGVGESERIAMHVYCWREREQNRAANLALLKGLWRLFLGTLLALGKVALVLLLLYIVMVGFLAL